MLLMIDNYDSFTFNLVQYFGELGVETAVHRNDQITPDDIARLRPEYIVLSPGPCTPARAGISIAVVRRFKDSIPLLGVCLGHQAIAVAFGGSIGHAPLVMHGKTSAIHHLNEDIFTGLGNPFRATRYHSLVVDAENFPQELEITAWSEDATGARGDIMGLRHRDFPVYGVQFHPESILTEDGKRILANFLRL